MNTCKKCVGEIPNSVVIDGVQRSLRTRKYCLGCSPFGGHNTQKIELEKKPAARRLSAKGPAVCTKCRVQKGESEFYWTKGIRYSWCKSCFKAHTAGRNRINKLRLVQEFGGCCLKCGYSKHPSILHFHHRNAATKSFNISAGICFSYARLKKEAAKCDLLCPNCHAVHHELVGPA